jgi:hypothetical protein
MTKKKNDLAVVNADPIDFLHGLVTGGIDNASALVSTALKGVRDRSLKEDLVLEVKRIADEGKLKLSQNDDPYDIYDDIEAIYKDIEDGINIKKYRIIKSIFMGMITLDEKERVFCRKLISIVRDLTLDAVQVLEIITSVQAESVRETANQDLYVSKLADLAGLRYSNFGYSAIENLSANGIVSRSYMDIRVKSGLTDLGIDLSERVRNA